MPMRVLIVGSGRQAVAAGYDLVRFQPETRLTLCDANPDAVAAAAGRLRGLIPELRLEEAVADAADFGRLSELGHGHDAVLAGVPYHLNPLVHQAAAEAGISSVDMGSDLPDLEAALGPKVAYEKSVVVFDSGLAPGLGNQLAAMLIEENPGTTGVKILCGGLPLEPRTPMKYKPRFSLEGLVGEYSDPATALVEGTVAELESLSDLEMVEIEELGTFEAFVTSGGSSIGPQLHRNHLQEYAYKTLRFPGHCASMRAHRDRGDWRPENLAVFAREFAAATEGEDDRDQVILVVEAHGHGEMPFNHRSSRLVIHATHDEGTGFSAMEQLTGFSASIVLQQILEGKPEPGLYAAEECVSGRTMIDELAKRGIRPRA